ILAYRYLFDMSEAEMAQALGCERGTVKSRLSRAMHRTRQAMLRVAPLLVLPVDLGLWLGHVWPAAPTSSVGSQGLGAAVWQQVGSGGGAASAGGANRPSVQQPGLALGGAGGVVAAAPAVGLLLSAHRPPAPPPASPASPPVTAAVGGS